MEEIQTALDILRSRSVGISAGARQYRRYPGLRYGSGFSPAWDQTEPALRDSPSWAEVPQARRDLMTLPKAYLFLMQEEFSTGQTVVVDGGTVLV